MILALGNSSSGPAEQMLTDLNFRIVDHCYSSADLIGGWSDSSSSAWSAEHFLISGTSSAIENLPVAEKKQESKTESTPSTRRFINVRSLIIAGPSGCGKSSKLTHLTTFAEEAGMDVKTVDASIFQFETCDSPQVIVCPNIETIDQLTSAIKYSNSKSNSTQLLLGTSLTEEQLAPMNKELCNLEFDICYFKAISVEERIKSAAIIAAGGLPPTICLDWAKEWASRDTEHWFAKQQRNLSE